MVSENLVGFMRTDYTMSGETCDLLRKQTLEEALNFAGWHEVFRKKLKYRSEITGDSLTKSI